MASASPAWTKENFTARLRRQGHYGCWEWLGTRNDNGYGVASVSRRTTGAHRLGWLLLTGEDPGKLFVCHHCDNPPCCNPAHLFLGDAGRNRFDMTVKGRAQGELRHVPWTHEDGLTAFNLLSVGADPVDIGKALGCHWPAWVLHLASMAEYRLRCGITFAPPCAPGF